MKAEEIVQAQLEAYNAHDLAAWLATYAKDAQQFEFPATLLASGHEQIKERAAARFSDPQVHARLISRTVIGELVIDHEMVTRMFPEGLGEMELTCLYQVRAGQIQSASFIFGAVTLKD
jgi:hypothetical protein